MNNGNLTSVERIASGFLGLLLGAAALRGGRPWLRAVGAVAGVSLLARAASGHCAVKAAALGHSSLADGVKDEWRGLRRAADIDTHGRPGSPLRAAHSQSVDEGVRDSFPASDPPASHLPDEVPANAEAKWAAARAAGIVK
jgi:Protein of unknown function (DUF2892)